MGMGDKIKSKAEEMLSTAKGAAGSVTGNDDLETDGQHEQAQSEVKRTGEDVRDTFKG